MSAYREPVQREPPAELPPKRVLGPYDCTQCGVRRKETHAGWIGVKGGFRIITPVCSTECFDAMTARLRYEAAHPELLEPPPLPPPPDPPSKPSFWARIFAWCTTTGA